MSPFHRLFSTVRLQSPLHIIRHALPYGRHISLLSGAKKVFKTQESQVLDKITAVPFYELTSAPAPIQLNWLFLFLDAVFTFVPLHAPLSYSSINKYVSDTEVQAPLWPGDIGHTKSLETKKGHFPSENFDLPTTASPSHASTSASDPSLPYGSSTCDVRTSGSSGYSLHPSQETTAEERCCRLWTPSW